MHCLDGKNVSKKALGDSIITAAKQEKDEDGTFESFKTNLNKDDQNGGVANSIRVTDSYSGSEESQLSITTAIPTLDDSSTKLKDVYIFPQKSLFVKVDRNSEVIA